MNDKVEVVMELMFSTLKAENRGNASEAIAGLRKIRTAIEQLTAGGEAELRIIFDGLPSLDAPRFIEVENARGESINAGEWARRDDGLCELRIATVPKAEHDKVLARVRDCAAQLSEIAMLQKNSHMAMMVERVAVELSALSAQPSDEVKS